MSEPQISDWKKFPARLRGQDIEMDFEGKMIKGNIVPDTNKFVFKVSAGRVIDYTVYNEMHTVSFDNIANPRDINLKKATFWILHKSGRKEKFTADAEPTYSTSYGGYGGYGGYQSGSAYPNYGYPQQGSYQQSYQSAFVSKTVGASTEVTFNVLVESRVLFPKDTVRINGSIPELTAWGDGIDMIADVSYPNLWSVTIELPYTLEDDHVFGLFSFRYEIVNHTGKVIPEGTGRDERKLRPNFYHTFKPNYLENRFKGMVYVDPKHFCVDVSRILLEKYLNSQLTASLFLQQFVDLTDSIAGLTRAAVETMFEDHINHLGSDMSNENVLVFLAMIGRFGVTSHEKVNATSYNYTYGPNGMAYPTYQAQTYRLPPQPCKWVEFCVENLDIAQLFEQPWVEILGKRHRLAAIGLQEAVERLSEHGSFDWLLMFPLLSKYPKLFPRISKISNQPAVTSKKKKKANRYATATLDENNTDVFVEVADIVIACIADIRARQLQTDSKSQQPEDVEKSNNNMTDSTTSASAIDIESTDVSPQAEEAIGLSALATVDTELTIDDDNDHSAQLSAKVLCDAWMSALIKHAPTLQTLITLLGRVDTSTFSMVVDDVADRLEFETFSTTQTIDLVREMVLNMRLFLQPQIASALLKNSTMDSFKNHLLEIVRMCSESYDHVCEEALLQVIKDEEKDAPGTVLGTGLKDEWLALNTAAKEWIRRNHEIEPTTLGEEVRAISSSYLGSWSGFGGQQQHQTYRKPPTDAQLRNTRIRCVEAALEDVDALLRIPLFAKHSQGALFELSRCWFFVGSVVPIVDAVCSVGMKSTIPFQQYCQCLINFLEGRLARYVRDAVASKELYLRFIDLLMELLPRDSLILRQLLFRLVAYVTWPSSQHADNAAGDTQQCATVSVPSFASVVANDDMWIRLVNAFPVEIGAIDILSKVLIDASVVVLDVANQLVNNSITVDVLKILLPRKDSFLEIMDSFCDCPSLRKSFSAVQLTRSMLEEAERTLTKFDATMDHLRTYVSFFCSCGVSIERAELQACIERLREDYHKLRGCDLEAAFSGVGALPHIEWLYKLRSSELFLHLWRNVGTDFSVQVTQDRRNALFSNELDVEGDTLAAVLNMFQQQGEDLPPEVRADQQLRADVIFQSQDQKAAIVKEIENTVFTQEYAVHHLIPAAQQTWLKLATEVLSGQADIGMLDKTFARFARQGVEAMSVELDLLISAIPKQPSSDMSEMARNIIYSKTKRELKLTAFSSLQDYLLLLQLRGWIPSILRVHEQLRSLFSSEIETDPYRILLVQSIADIKTKLSTLTLETLSNLVNSTREFATSPSHVEFLSILSSAPELVEWLLAHKSTEEFNRLLQVVRPCTDEPRLLSAIASLVHVRTLLLQPLAAAPFNGLTSFLRVFFEVDMASAMPTISAGAGGASTDSALWHVNNIISTFDSLKKVFEKQTLSPGIKSCHDLHELFQHGRFVVSSQADSSKVLKVRVLVDGEVKIEQMEYLLDLRSKLLMTEIPKELDDEINASAMVEAFVGQLQVLSEMSDVLAQLYNSGHIDYQDNYSTDYQFTLTGMLNLQQELKRLQDEAQVWKHSVRKDRNQHYFLNYFTMREVLRLRYLVSLEISPETFTTAPAVSTSTTPAATTTSSSRDSGETGRFLAFSNLTIEEVSCISVMEDMGFSREWSYVALRRCDQDIAQATEYCFNHTHHMDRIVEDEMISLGQINSSISQVEFVPTSVIAEDIDVRMEILGLLHQISSSFEENLAMEAIINWKNQLSLNVPVLQSLGSTLSDIFSPQASFGRCTREVAAPGPRAVNRADLLYSHDDGTEKRMPVFVACAEEPSAVIDTVLSIYVRRGRIPEPSEVYFCTTETTVEDLNILLLRFIVAKRYGRGDFIYCIADIHNLSYTKQCSLVEILRSLTQEQGCGDAATLVIISGLPRQVAQNALSTQQIDLPPLDAHHLRLACADAFEIHCGETRCVASTINGGGKTHHIMSTVGMLQEIGEIGRYRKIPIRESSDSSRIVEMMCSMKKMCSSRIAYHIDIGHIIPASANTMLFQLLIIGVLRDPISSRVYFRSSLDKFYLEVPNSLRNKTAVALRFCQLLPTTILEVRSEDLDFRRPTLRRESPEYIDCVEYSELSNVCQWLLANKSKKLQKRTPNYDRDFSAFGAVNLQSQQCFELLTAACSNPDGPSPYPSWSIFHSFVMFMNAQFQAYVTCSHVADSYMDDMEGFEEWRSTFLHLLIETSKDFALRSVAQVPGVGPAPSSEDLIGEQTSALNYDGLLSAEEDSKDDSPRTGAPKLMRSNSSELRRTTQMAAAAAPAMQRMSSEEVVQRFQSLISWEQSDHPIVVFKLGFGGVAEGVDILSLNPEYCNRYIKGNLKQILALSGIKFDRDWSTITNHEAVDILRKIEGLDESFRGGVSAMVAGYVMTIDNMLKMLSIQLRLRFHLPVIIMGETGAGKSSLIINMCNIIGVPLHIFNVHGGIEDRDIIVWMNKRIQVAQKAPNDRLMVFLDEINTCNSMALFKEIVCDRSMNGVPLPHNIRIIAACNPYRLRTTASLYGGEEMAGLAFETFCTSTHVEGVGSGITDPLRNLVYRVHPLPESMVDFVFDFGSLSSETEQLYIQAMLRQQLGLYNEESSREAERDAAAMRAAILEASGGGRRSAAALPPVHYKPMTPFSEFVEVFSELVCGAQECVRSLNGGERSAASLRDVARCVKIFSWFGHHFAKNVGVCEGWDAAQFFTMSARTHKYIRKAVILSLAYCYHARLPRRERDTMINVITKKWRDLQAVARNQTYNYPSLFGGGGGISSAAPILPYQQQNNYNRARCTWLALDPTSFNATLVETQREFVNHMNLGEGIALNEALLENLFMILLSVLNQIPVFVIGKPGSSKSLAMGLIQSNLNGDASDNDFLKSLPAVEIFSYQCSPLSTSQGIQQAFETARRYKREAANTIVVVLLDEVGLAEQSPHLPLKVLHKMLDEAVEGEAVVGISNWALDPAKMNRAVHLYRPAPCVEDLSLTAEGMVKSANLKGYLHALARAYNETYRRQGHEDFWGLREFYSTVRAINTSLSRAGHTEGVALNAPMLLNAVLRNFGGRPHEMEQVVGCFFGELGISVHKSWKDVSIESLIVENLSEPDARHLMLLTKNNAALSLLLDRGVLTHDKTEILFGSDFPLDQTDLQICLNIQRIKLCMAEGIPVVLVHCESLYESLYDLLNQHYVEYSGQLYVRLAFGSYTRLCPIHRAFRVIVIVETIEAYTKLAPPLLNRFEKQVYERKDVLRPDQMTLLSRLQRFAVAFATCCQSNDSKDSSLPNLAVFRNAFCGYHNDMLSSLLLVSDAINKRNGNVTAANESELHMSQHELEEKQENALFLDCVKRLLWIATPEATCRLMNGSNLEKDIHKEFGINCSDEYFKHQTHSSLIDFANKMMKDWRDEMGCQAVLVTHSPLNQNAAEILRSCPHSQNTSHIVLHEIDQERSLRTAVNEFFKTAGPGSTLLVQCDPLATSKRRIEHTKFVIELARAKQLKLVLDAKTKFAVSAVSSSSASAAAPETIPPPPPSPAEEEGAERHQDFETELPLGVNVILLLHLPRAEDGEARYLVEFDTRWRTAFIDSVASADTSGLPSIENMIGKSLLDIVHELNLKKVLAKSFRMSLSRLSFANERTNADVKQHILTILQCLEDEDFVNLVRVNLVKMLTLSSTSKDLNLNIVARREKELLLSGTFQGAIHLQILNTVASIFAGILSHMDRNNSLHLFLNKKWKSDWLQLFAMSFNTSLHMDVLYDKRVAGKQVRGSENKIRRGDIIVKNDGFSQYSFSSQFPYSFFVSSLLDSMRKTTEFCPEDLLIGQFSAVGVTSLSGSLSSESIDAYIVDLVSMKCRIIPHVSRAAQGRLLRQILNSLSNSAADSAACSSSSASPMVTDVCRMGAIDKLASIHHRFWRIERIVELYFDIVQCHPMCLNVFEDFVLHKLMVLDASAHSCFLNLVFATLEPWKQVWCTEQWYDSWTTTVAGMQNHVLSLIDLIDNVQLQDDLRTKWTKLQFFTTFVREVAIPLQMTPVVLQHELLKYEHIELRSQTALRCLLLLLQGLHVQMVTNKIGTSDELMCPISLAIFRDPVLAADGQTYERKVIQDWFRQGHNTSPYTNLPMIHQLLRPNVVIAEKISSIATCDLGRFLEYYIFDVVFRATGATSLDAELMKDLVVLAGARSPLDLNARATVLPAYAARIGILRELVKVMEVPAVRVIVQNELDSVKNWQAKLDNQLSLLYVTVCEEKWSNLTETSLQGSHQLDDVSLMNGSRAMDVLDCVAWVRMKLIKSAHILSNVLGDEHSHLTEFQERIVNASFGFLSSNVISAGLSRVMRVFLLKQVERRRGISFLRNAMLQPLLTKSAWLINWKSSGDMGLSRFLGGNKIPKLNPFIAFPGFKETQLLISQFLITTDVSSMENALFALKGAGHFKGAFLLAVFHEIAMISVLPEDTCTAVAPKRDVFIKWLAGNGPLRFLSESERRIVMLFAAASVSSDISSMLQLGPSSSTDAILRCRVAAHMAAVSLTVPESHPFAFLKTLMVSPIEAQDSFFPTMPEDMLKMAQEAMGGRWYKCPNQHPYWVDQCGRPTVVQKCAECGVDIGGLSHQSLPGTIDIGNVGTGYHLKTVIEDTTDKNYCVRSAEEEVADKFYAPRGLSPSSTRLIRIFMHLAMLIGSSAVPMWSTGAANLFNRGYCNPLDHLFVFIEQHISLDWELLRTMLLRSVDDMCVVMHLVLLSCTGFVGEPATASAASASANITALPPAAAAANPAVMLARLGRAGGASNGTAQPVQSFATLSTCAVRSKWEEELLKDISKYLNSTDLVGLLARTEKQFGKIDDNMSVFESELLELFDIASISEVDRKEQMPGLWMYTRKFDLSHFQYSVESSEVVRTQHNVLLQFIKQEHRLRALKFMPQVFEWFRLLKNRYSGRLERGVARHKRCGDVLAEIDDSERPKWERAFRGFTAAWNIAWPGLDKTSCVIFPSEFKNLVMSLDVPVSFCLINELDEGLCPLSLAQALINKHNEFVQLVDEALLLHVRRAHRESVRAKLISSRFLTEAHTFRCDFHLEFLPFVEKQCILDSGHSYDFAKAEEMLMDRFLVNAPAIDFEQSAFTYSHEQQGALLTLREKLHQELLSPDIVEYITRDLSNPADSQRLLELVETVVDFLVSIGGNFVQSLDASIGDMLLSKYVKSVLLIDDSLISNTIAQQIRLKHVVSFHALLRDLTTVTVDSSGRIDIFGKVDDRYKVPISDSVREALMQAMNAPLFNTDQLLTCMKSFILENLVLNSTINISFQVYDVIQDCQNQAGDALAELDWFSQHFPRNLVLGQIVSAYEFLSGYN